MSYTPTNWQTGDTITAEKLNNMESGIENGQTLVVTITQNGGVYVADKTFSEITSAWSAGKIVIADASAVGSIGVLYLTKVNASSVLFSSARGADIYTIMMSSGGTVSPSYKFNLYSKPSTGIPQTDLAQAVQNKLDPFVVTLTPTAQDYSGTMDKTVAEINTAYKAGQQIVFRVLTSANSYVDVPMSYAGRDAARQYPDFGAEIIQYSNNLMIVAHTGDTDDGTKQTYSTRIYSITPMS
jgi:hypothetical protein